MKVIAHFYAQLRDLIGEENREIELTEPATVSDLLQRLYGEFPALRAHDKTILIGVGVEFVDRNYKLKTADEISIMPPVQGG
jgi:MoaE-MoaD fusion protein